MPDLSFKTEPKRIKGLVYVAAYLPRDGESLLSFATSDADAKIGPSLMVDNEPGIVSVEKTAHGELFANGAPEPVKATVADAIVDEPLAPLATRCSTVRL